MTASWQFWAFLSAIFAASGARRISQPSSSTVPAVGSRSPIIMRMVVVLPAPLRPRKPNTMPASIAKVRSSTATSGP